MDVDRRIIQLIESNSEIGAGTRGASLGVDAMRVASWNKRSPFFAEHNVIAVGNENHRLSGQNKTIQAKHIEGLINVCKEIESTVSKTLLEGKFPIVMAGDHSSAHGSIAGVKAAYPDKKIGVIWIDAHADIHTPYTSPSGNVHGMPVGATLGLTDEGRLATGAKSNPMLDETVKLWDEWMKLGNGISPKATIDNLVYVGVRDTEAEEDALIAKHNIPNYTVSKYRKLGVEAVADAIFGHLSDCDYIYITFDVDSMDSDIISHGTGTPVPNGFFEYEIVELLDLLLANEKVCCFEITEINPTLDEKKNRMAETGFGILQHVVRELTGE